MPHIHEKIDFTVSVYIVHDDAVLLRMHEKYHSWFPVGGHIELDEDPNQAAIREAKEESGLDVTLIGGKLIGATEGEGYQPLISPLFLDRHLVAGGPHVHVDLVYAAVTHTRDIRPRDEEVVTDLRWFTEKDLEDPAYSLMELIRENARVALHEARI